MANTLKLATVTLVGHSWGSDVGTLVCTLGGDIISRYISVEGDLHVDNIFISQIVSQAYHTMTANDFRDWLWHRGFPEYVLGWNFPAALRYLSSVKSCVPRVFGDTAAEIVQQCETADKDGILSWGHAFAELSVPRIYCWGSLSIQKDSQVIKFLDNNIIEHKCFADATHWVMEDKPGPFYTFLKNRIL
jgi:pimeloyl-ACP methyl ester carboxylesterase